MTTDAGRWRELQRLFFESVDLDPPLRRARLERIAREDRELADRLRALLDAADESQDRVSDAVSAGAVLVCGPARAADDGQPIDRYCDDRRMSLAGRLRLLTDVVSEPPALSDGTIRVDERGRPRRGSQRADVASLGAVVYELLTGTRPDADPVAPSELPWTGRGSDRGDWTAYRAARDRRLRPPALRRRLRGDLDAIAMKALARDPADRYGSTRELAEDLTRYLDRRPVSAGPDRWSYCASRSVVRLMRGPRQH